MDRPRRNDLLAVNKTGKKIKKTPLHLPSLANGRLSKNGFRSIVPQLTSSPVPQLHNVRPAALTQINRPLNLARPPMMSHADQFWSDITADSPVSVHIPSLQSSSGPNGYQSPSPLIDNKSLPSARFSGGGILPTPVSVRIGSPQSSFRDSGPNINQMQPSHDYQQPQHSPGFHGSASSVPILPSPRFNGRGILPTPPGVQCPPPLTTRKFTSSSMAQGGILGPGKFPHASTALVFSPSSFRENTN